MTAPLYDVKARLSEYVTMAEEGEVIVITKHGKGSVMLISEENMMEWARKSAQATSRLKKWREKYADCLSDEFDVLLEDIRKEPWSLASPPFNEAGI